MWCGWSPREPRRSAICLLLPRLASLKPLSLALSPRGRGDLNLSDTFSCGDKGVDRVGRQVVVVTVVEPHHRRELASAEALDLFEAEESIRRHLVRAPDSDRLLDVVDDLARAAQRAAEVRAHIEAVLAHWIEVKQRVKGRDALDVSRVELERRRDL